MSRYSAFVKLGVPLRKAAAAALLLVNVFAWYSYTSSIVRQLIEASVLAVSDALVVYFVVGFASVVVSMIVGASVVGRHVSRSKLIAVWTMIGVFSSLLLVLIRVRSIWEVVGLSSVFGVSFGFGLPAALAFFQQCTFPENRARFGSVILLVMSVGVACFSFLFFENVVVDSVIALGWRALGLLAVPLMSPGERLRDDEVAVGKTSFWGILRDRSFLLYLAPWVAFSLVNYLAITVADRTYGSQFVSSTSFVENIIAGVCALAAGFAADIVGRKRTLIAGFVGLGMGYAVLGVYPSSLVAWYFYTVVDGVAWGVIYVMFWFTIWGDLAHEKLSDKYYALGILPYSLSSLLRVTFGPLITASVSVYAIFSMAAFFLFVAVVPLMYAPETLPEKNIKDRELRVYLEKAKKVKEKYV